MEQKVKDLRYVSNAEIAYVIDSYVHSERDRALMKRKMLDDIHFEPLGEEFQLSTTQVKRIYKKHKQTIESLL